MAFRTLSPVLLFVGLALAGRPASAAYSSLVQTNLDGTLSYTADARGNVIPDFSYSGYKNGEEAIPDNVPIIEILTPQPGDCTAYIQAAIDQVAARPLNADGFRGAVHLRAGVYEVSDTLDINYDGIVLQGDGTGANGTLILHHGTNQQATIQVQPPSPFAMTFSHVTGITDDYVPVGAKSFHVQSTAGLSVGQTIFVRCNHTQSWIDTLGLTAYWPLDPEWVSALWERTIVDIQGNEITIDGPITTAIDNQSGYATGEIVSVNLEGRVSNVGIQDLIFMSDYDRTKKDSYGHYNDEAHANRAVYFLSARDGWVRRCTGFFYVFSMVDTWKDAYRITVQDCAMLDGVSLDTPNVHAGGREYSFNAGGHQYFGQRLFTRGARHAFIMGGMRSGHVFLHCKSAGGHLSPEPHQRWTSGVLFDNVYSDSEFKLAGSNLGVHGQQAANCAMWNCTSENTRWWEPEIWLNNPTDGGGEDLAQNWVVGCLINGLHSDPPISNFHNYGGPGHVESTDTPVEPNSLFISQLEERIGEGISNIVDDLQFVPGSGMFDQLSAKYADVPAFGDPKDLGWLMPPVPEFIVHSELNGPGVAAPSINYQVVSGALAQVVYTADIGFVISSFTTDGSLVPEAIGKAVYTADYAHVQADMSNRVVFAWNGISGGEAGLIAPSQLVVTSSDYYSTAEDSDAFNGNGLTGDTHNASWADAWLSGGGGAAGKWIKVDLGDTNILSHLRVWNYNQTGLPNRGVAQADIYVAMTNPGSNVDGSGAVFNTNGWALAVENRYFVQSPGGGAITNTDPFIALNGVQAAFLAIRVDANHGATQDDVGLSEVQVYAGAVADEDADGLPGAWESTYGLDPHDDGSIDPDQGADGDPDEDGATNGDELAADTDPGDAGSVFAITGLTRHPNGPVEVACPSSGARDYYLSGNDHLPATNAWSAVAGPAAGNGVTLTLTDTEPPDSPPRAYRMEVQVP